MAIFDQMRVSVPDDLRQAQHVLEERDRIMAQAHSEAQLTLSSADEEARARVESHDITRLAQARGEEIQADAQRKAQDIIAQAESLAQSRRSDADQYVLDILRRLDQQLSNYLTSIRTGMEAMETELKRP